MTADSRTHYSQVAADYAAKNDEASLTDAFRAIRDTFTDTVDGDRLLDLGCGHGRDARYFADHGYDVVGVDNAQGMIDVAQTATDTDAVNYVQADIRDLPFIDEAFDGVWAPATLFLLPYESMDDTIAEVYRVLQEDGVVLSGVKTGNGPEPRDDFGSTVTQYRIDPDTFYDRLTDAGFTVADVSGSVNADGYGFKNYVCRKP